jgi:murein DD-endopeptidase MepM/ murein hydrolase activator NlpD
VRAEPPRRARPLVAMALAVTLLSGCGGAAEEPVPPVTITPVTTPAVTPSPSLTPSSAATPSPSPPAIAEAPAGNEFPLAGCRASFGHGHHGYPATDIFAPAGCRFVAPADGVVDEITTTDRWRPGTNKGADRGGRSVSVVGDDGVRYYGSHLRSVEPGVRPGLRVRRGQVLGRVGNSGSARGIASHLHFGLSWPTRDGIWWVRRGVIDPWPYLRAWQRGGQRSPVRAVAAARRAAGAEVPRCTEEC